MAVKRNDRVTSVLGSIDRRVKALESGGNFSIPASSIIAEAETSLEPNNGVTVIPPNTFKRIVGARVYSPAATGNLGTRVELYFNETLAGLEVFDVNSDPLQVQIFGVNGYTGVPISLSSGKLFRPIEIATNTPTWATNGFRDKFNQTGWRETPPVAAIPSVTVNSAIWYNPIVQDPDKRDKDGKTLLATRAIDSATASLSTVTVTLNSDHLYRVGDIIAIDIPNAPFCGLDYYSNGEPDGLFEITAVTSDTITYQLDQPVSTPQTYEYQPANGRHYVYAVARGYVPDGTVWTYDNPNSEVDTVWVWKKLRWYNTADPIGDVTATQDGIAPSPVTNLELDSEVPVGDTSPNIILTWTPPTTRSNGASISGFFSGYEIWYKRSTDATWKTEFVRDTAGTVTTHTLKDPSIVQNRTYNIRVYVVDIMSQVSTAATGNILTATFSEVLNPPSKPLVSSRLGTIKITWDGDDSTGNLPVPGVLYIEFHASNTSGFTPSDATLVGTAPSVIDGNYIVLSDLTYGANYFFKTIFVRRLSPLELDKSLPSVQSDAIQVARLVNTDLIANTISGAAIQSGTITASDKIIGNTITGALIQALAIDTGQLKANAITADKIEGGAISGVVIRGDVIKTANTGTRVELSNTGIYAYDGNTPVFSFNTSTASLTIGGYATTSALTGVSTTASNALTTAEGKLGPGSAAADVNAFRNTTTITGAAITTGTIDAARITVTDTFRYASSTSLTPPYEVKLGQNAIGSYGGTSAGIGFYQNGTQYGYIATWGARQFEVGADFNEAYITIGLGNNYSFESRFSNGYTFKGTTVNFETAVTAYRESALAFRIGSDSLTQSRLFLADTLVNKRITLGNGGVFGTPPNTTPAFPDSNNTLDVFGAIRASGAITANFNLSSLRYKTDVRDYNVPESVLDLTPRVYKYVNAEVYRTWKEQPAHLPEFSEDFVGFIAEDAIALGLDYLVIRDSDGLPDSLDYAKISVFLVPLIKDLKNRIQALEERS